MQQGQFFDVSQPCPRVNGASMGNFVGKRVSGLVVGRVLAEMGGLGPCARSVQQAAGLPHKGAASWSGHLPPLVTQVKLVGQVSDVGDGQLKVKAPDGLPITVVLTNAAPNAAIVEFEGLVESPDTLKEESQTIFKEGFGAGGEGCWA